MKLTAKVELLPTPEQRACLLDTMRRFNAACNHISTIAWETRTFKQIPLHHLHYHATKERFGLSAQMVVRANARVVDAYKLDKRTKRSFRELGAITYDDRILSWKPAASTVSIWTVGGRQTIPFVCGEYQRRLKKLSGKERRFANDVNHRISKRIVEKAQRTNRAIALEDLKGIRQRSTLHSWAFHDLGQKLRYKAQRAGVPLVFVDPRNTSRQCPVCGHTERANRPNQSTFTCVACGFAGLADHIAAVNIGRRAAVNQPNVGEANRALHGSVPASLGQNPSGFGQGS